LRELSNANRALGFTKEGIEQAREALEIFKLLNDTVEQAICLGNLAWMLFNDNQLDTAEDAVSRMIDLLPEKGQESLVCESHRLLGLIYRSKGGKEKEKAIHYFKTALGIASSFGWDGELFWIHFNLAELFNRDKKFNDANTHIKQAKLHAVNNNKYLLGRGMQLQAHIWFRQCKLEDSKSEALCALKIYEEIGVVKEAECCRGVLQEIEQAIASLR
jgi:tetratricopeptide (TPR) repeat protein